MFVSDSITVNEKGHLDISGADCVMLAKKYETPLYVMSEDGIRNNIRCFKKSIDNYYSSNGLVIFASKAFCCKEMCRIAKSEQIGLDVVSMGELLTALSVDFPTDKIFFHGNNKSYEEIKLAIHNNIGCIIVDNAEELDTINEIAVNENKTVNIMLRIKPGIDAHTHDFIKTGQIDSKFGFALENGEAFAAVKKALSCKSVRLIGLHCHIGSQIFDVEPFVCAAQVMLEFIYKIKCELDFEIDKLNLGGGFGIKYLESDKALSFDEYLKFVSVAVKEKCNTLKIKLPFIIIEPGRSIVGCEGITLYTVGSVKNIEGIRKYVAVDGSMADNPRHALYNADYSAVVANKATAPLDDVVTIAGKCCESGDIIQENLKLQTAQKGDILAVFSTGAYNYSMASNYNRISKPAVVMVSGGNDRIIIKREQPTDVLRNDV